MGSNNDNDASVSCKITEGHATESGVAINVEPDTVVEYMNSDNNIIGEYEVVIDADQCPRPEDNSIPCLGMRFKTADDAYTWYKDYARRIGFKVRIDRQERSKRDGEVISRLFVCSRKGTRREKNNNKESKCKAEQTHARVGCQAYLMVKRRRGPVEDSWEITRFQEHHNHDLVSPSSMVSKRKISKRKMALDEPCPISEQNYCPHLGMQFRTADEAYIWYNHYARRMGFRVRIDRQERSKRDKEVISRLFVCSKKGTRRKKYNNRDGRSRAEQGHTRVGCQAYLMVKRRRGATGESWEVTRFQELHNHDSASLSNKRMGPKNKNGKFKVALDIESGTNSEDDSCPRLGLQFKTADDAYQWYNDYARRVGFSVRIDRQERSKRDGEVISRLFVCSKQGRRREKYTNKESTTKGEQPHTRVGCQAYLMVKRRRGSVEDNWVVTRFQDVHKHDLVSPSKVSSLRSHKRIRHTSEKYAENLSGACVDGNGIFSSLVDGADGIENVGYIQQNLFDHQTFEIQDTFANEDPNIAQEMQKNNSQCNVINGLLFNQGLMSGAEKQRKGTKSCSICKGHDHNKRKCPTLKGIGHSQQPESDAHLHLSDSHLQIGDSDLHMDDSHPHMIDTHHPHLSDSQEHMSDSHPGFCALSLWNDKHTSDVMSNQAVKQLFGWVVTDDGEDFRVCSELLPTEV